MLANVSFEMESTNYQLVPNADHNTNSKLGEDPPPNTYASCSILLIMLAGKQGKVSQLVAALVIKQFLSIRSYYLGFLNIILLCNYVKLFGHIQKLSFTPSYPQMSFFVLGQI